MTEEQQELCCGLVILPDGSRGTSKENFARQFPAALRDGKLAVELLEGAYIAQNSDELDCALIVGFAFGFARVHTEILCRLFEAGWHSRHEDLISALDKLRTPDAVETFFHATQWIPESLQWDESRALAVKAIWALGKLPTAEAETKLQILARSDNAIVRNAALQQLQRRHKHSN